MAKCKALTGSAVKGLMCYYWCVTDRRRGVRHIHLEIINSTVCSITVILIIISLCRCANKHILYFHPPCVRVLFTLYILSGIRSTCLQRCHPGCYESQNWIANPYKGQNIQFQFNPLKRSGITFKMVQCHSGLAYIFNFWYLGTVQVRPGWHWTILNVCIWCHYTLKG